MNKQGIIKTAETRWDEVDQCYITKSPLAECISGCGDSPEEAFNVFLEMVEANWEAYKKGVHGIYNRRPGRPKGKEKVVVTIHIDPDVKKVIQRIAEKYGLSQGEAIEYAIGKLEVSN